MRHDLGSVLVLDDRRTAAEAWVAASSVLSERRGHAYNLVYCVTEPSTRTSTDATLVRRFDAFARDNGLHSTETVANTIFPLDTYRSRGASFYDFYLDEVLPKVRKQWGTYFERMTRRRNDDGSVMVRDGIPLNPLSLLVDKLARRTRGGGTTTHYELSLEDASFEIPTYDPQRDGAYQVGGPCLSHVSFKLDRSGAVRLTAFYRSHWYVARALGNLIGLARLQTFVARSIGAPVGPLTIIASEAVLDVSATGRPAAATRTMLREAAALYGFNQSRSAGAAS